MAVYQNNIQMINTGIYQKGSSASIDQAIEKHELIEEFLKQDTDERCTMKQTLDRLAELAEMELPETDYNENPNLPVTENL